MALVYIAGVFFLILFLMKLSHWQRIRSLRRQGVYPQPGQASMSDVERLVKAGHRIEAMVCYRELFPKAGLAEAKETVDALNR
ncbi:MAG: hypothetical protein K0Q55_2137 [Verrucomicrobia bacterium]|jgi:hypothetical protein|nr:hypothetical protein [Verrucomicrobiota bacterium]